MRTELINEYYGKIIYDESIWTGKKEITIDGRQLSKLKRNSYRYYDGEKDVFVQLKGSFLSGVSFIIEGRTIRVTEKPKWYEQVLAWFTLVFILVWGNIPTLFMIFPVISGAIGGALAGVTACFSLLAMRQTKKPLLKVLIGIGCSLTCIFVCFILGLYAVALLA